MESVWTFKLGMSITVQIRGTKNITCTDQFWVIIPSQDNEFLFKQSIFFLFRAQCSLEMLEVKVIKK